MRKGEYVFLLLCTILVYIAIHVSLGCCREVEAGYFKLQNVSFFVKIGTRHGFRKECKKSFGDNEKHVSKVFKRCCTK